MLQVCRYIFQSLPLTRFMNFNGASYRLCSVETRHTAGLIIIGDEILKAQVKDTNSYFMCKLLYECGVKVKKISIISDDVDEIANEIRDFAERYTYVITSGGIGPTHDDMTFEGLARAFDDTLHYDPTLLEIVKKIVINAREPDSPGRKLACIPKKATLKFGVNPLTGKSTNYPCVSLRNVYVFPGSPGFLEPLFTSVYRDLFKTNRKFVKTEVYIDAKEDTFAAALTSVAAEFPRATFGSYPVNDLSLGYKARVTIESEEEKMTNEARDRFMSLLPTSVIINCNKAEKSHQ